MATDGPTLTLVTPTLPAPEPPVPGGTLAADPVDDDPHCRRRVDEFAGRMAWLKGPGPDVYCAKELRGYEAARAAFVASCPELEGERERLFRKMENAAMAMFVAGWHEGLEWGVDAAHRFKQS
jgi:hypothetical protein